MTLIQVAISGLLIGGIYTLLAAGITLIFGVLKVVNFAHGELLMIGMYATLTLYQVFGVHPYLALPIVATVMFLVGLAIHAGLIRWSDFGRAPTSNCSDSGNRDMSPESCAADVWSQLPNCEARPSVGRVHQCAGYQHRHNTSGGIRDFYSDHRPPVSFLGKTCN